MNFDQSRNCTLVAGALLLAFGPSVSSAQDAPYPNRALKIVVPATAGGTTDVIARAIGERLAASMGQAVVIDNKPGANAIVAVQSVIKSPADGYTLLLIHTALVQNLAFRSDSPYALKDLAAVSQVMSSSTAMAVPASLGVDTLADFVKLVRSKPGAYAYGSFGVGSTSHIYGETLKSAAQIDMAHAPYKGETLALNDLLGGQLAASWGAVGTFLPHVKSGKLKVLAVTGPQRIPQAPDVPTFRELGYASLNLNGWNGMLVAAATPAAVVNKLSDEVASAVQSTEVRGTLDRLGLIPIGSKHQAFADFLDADLKRWTTAIHTNGIKQE